MSGFVYRIYVYKGGFCESLSTLLFLKAKSISNNIPGIFFIHLLDPKECGGSFRLLVLIELILHFLFPFPGRVRTDDANQI